MADLKVYYEKDADTSALKGKTVAVLGYGSQGHAQAQNLRDSGVNVIIAELEGTDNYKLAVEHGFKPVSASAAAELRNIAAMSAPRRDRRPSRATNQKPYARMPTCSPEMASRWTVPVLKKSAVRPRSSCSRAPSKTAAARPARA